MRCDGKPGELAYLGRLRCASGGAPHVHFQRRGPRGSYGNETDEFGLRCVIDNSSYTVVFDRHHPDVGETEPVPGLGISDRVVRVPGLDAEAP